MRPSSDPFLQAMEDYRAAVLAKDVEAFVGLYDAHVHVFDMWGAWSLQGIDAWRGMAEAWFASAGQDWIVVDIHQAGSTCLGELAIGHATLTYTALSPDGRALRSLDNRMTAALRKTDGVWKIFHEHTSAPIDHASLQAILKRGVAG
ncbi:MAG: nuclear transport factor 2 family protein [Pseudoxanthomonas sp.]